MSRQENQSSQISGLLDQRFSLEHFDLCRIMPAEPLKEAVEFYWVITWDLRGKPAYEQENLPHPSQHIVIDTNATSIAFGINTGVFTYLLQQKGTVFGVKFWPGAFADFFQCDPAELTNTHQPLDGFLGCSAQALEQNLAAIKNGNDFAHKIDALLLSKQNKLSSKAWEARALVELVAKAPEINTILDLSKQAGASTRTIQRLFMKQIGVSPKWVIERYRMLAAVDAINNGNTVNLTQLAHQLSYYDQAHFSKAFKALTGKPPSYYWKKIQR